MNLIHHQPSRKQPPRPAPTPPSLLSLYPEKQVFGLGLRPSRSNIMTYTATNRKPCLHAKAIFAQPFIFGIPTAPPRSASIYRAGPPPSQLLSLYMPC